MAVIETLNASAPEKVAETVTVSMTRLFEKNRKLMLKTDVKPLFFSELHHLNKDGKAHETLQTILPATVNEGENTCRSPGIEFKGRFRHLHLCVPMNTHENHCSLSHVSLFIV